MQIQINTDHNIENNATLVSEISRVVESALDRLSDQITQVTVRLNDENSDKKGGNQDISCSIEAHLAGRPPVAVTHHAATVEQAVEGAADKLANLLESTLERLHDQTRHRAEDRKHELSLPEALPEAQATEQP